MLAAGSIDAWVPSALAPRVNVRWAPPVQESERRNVERALGLLEGAQVDGRTWAYDLRDPSRSTVEALVAHPLVEDTHHIDRAAREVSVDAPAGRTRIRGGLSTLRDSKLLGWVERTSFAVLLVSIVWLVTSRWRARGDFSQGDGSTSEQRQAGNDPL
jgi:hypothetical protein